VAIPPDDNAAKAIIERFQNGAQALRKDDNVSDTVSQHTLQDRTNLRDEIWLGTKEEELYAYVSEVLYIHSKLMIVDDRRVIMGSANINDRSQKGDGDSEIAVVVEDTDLVDTYMNGNPYHASRFAATLRRQLYKEHLGLIPPQPCDSRNPEVTAAMRPAPILNQDEFGTHIDNLVADPLSPNTDELWNSTAKRNREIFTEVFRPVPTNLVRSWAAYDNYKPKVKTGHVCPDIPVERIKELLEQVKGALVEAPLDFLIEDKDFVSGPEWTVLNPTLPIYI